MEHGITEPTRQDVIGFREQLKTEGKKASTIQNYITGLRQFFKWTEGTGAYPNIAKDVKGVRLNHTHKKRLFDLQASKECTSRHGAKNQDRQAELCNSNAHAHRRA